MRDTLAGDFPAYLREAMRSAGMDPDMRGGKAALARRMGVPDSLISRWLLGRGQPEIEHLRKAAPILHRPIRELVVAAGHLTPEEAGLTPGSGTAPDRTQAAERHIQDDPHLSQRDKDTLLAMLKVLRSTANP